jgi:hypothetical protein
MSPLRTRSGLPPATVLAELASIGEQEFAPLTESRYWAGVQKRVDALAGSCGPDTASYLEDRMGALADVAGSTPVRFGGWHGDLVPWNYARRRGQWQVWDWEYWQESAPIGLEEMQYVFGRQFFGAGLRAGEAAQQAVATRAPRCADDDHQHAVAALAFAFELLLRRLAITAVGGGSDDDRAFPDLYLIVDRLLHQGGASVSVPWPSTGPGEKPMKSNPDGEGLRESKRR